MLVIDAGATVDLLLQRPLADAIEGHIADHRADLHAPHLLDIEVASALRRLVSSGEAPASRALIAIEDLLDLPIERYPHTTLLPRIWELRAQVSAYDATYVALAEALTEASSPLLTTDGRLARAVAASSDAPVLLVA